MGANRKPIQLSILSLPLHTSFMFNACAGACKCTGHITVHMFGGKYTLLGLLPFANNYVTVAICHAFLIPLTKCLIFTPFPHRNFATNWKGAVIGTKPSCRFRKWYLRYMLLFVMNLLVGKQLHPSL